MTKYEYFDTCIKNHKNCEKCPFYDKRWDTRLDINSWCQIDNNLTYEEREKLNQEKHRYWLGKGQKV